jgi:glutamate--cysteine ligase
MANINEKHLRSIVKFLEDGAKDQGEGKFGLEIEHLVIDNETGLNVPYYGQHGIEEVLTELSHFYDEELLGKYNRLIGLERPNIAITLEPGAQFETSIGPFSTPEEFLYEYNEFLDEITPILENHNIRFVYQGYSPKSKALDIKIIPKERYDSMDEHLSKTGKFGRNMMRCSASTQVSIDYFSEADAINKLQVSVALGPILSYMFQNAPIFEGEPSKFKQLRIAMWDDLDVDRCSVPPGLFDSDFSFERYAKALLSIPLMVADFSNTPEKAGQKQVITASKETAGDLYPDRELNKGEVLHILSTVFYDTRLKNYVELRTVDSLPIDRAVQFTKLVGAIFYNTDNLKQVTDLIGKITEQDLIDTKTAIQENWDNAIVYGTELQEFVKLLNNMIESK